MQRSGLPLMILAGVLLVLAALVVYLVANPFSDRPRRERVEPEVTTGEPAFESADEPEPADDAEADPAPAPDAEPATVTEDEPAPAPEATRESVTAARDQETIPASTWTVRAGDTLYDIAGTRWSDPFLWPLLLAANDEAIEDPDYLRPGQRVSVPEWVTVESGLTAEQRQRVSAAHVLAYHHYRRLGDGAIGLGMGQPEWWRERLGRIRLNKAHWVLYSGLRYNEDLVSDFRDEIRADDAAEVRSFRERYGLPPTRRYSSSHFDPAEGPSG